MFYKCPRTTQRKNWGKTEFWLLLIMIIYLNTAASSHWCVTQTVAWAVSYPTETNEKGLGTCCGYLTNWACSCFSFSTLIYCNLNHYSYCNRDNLELRFGAFRGRIVIPSAVTTYPGSEVSGQRLAADLLVNEWWCCWKIWQNNWLILQMIMIVSSQMIPPGKPKYRPRYSAMSQESEVCDVFGPGDSRLHISVWR